MDQTDQRVLDDLARFDRDGRLAYRDRLAGQLLLALLGAVLLAAAAAYFFTVLSSHSHDPSIELPELRRIGKLDATGTAVIGPIMGVGGLGITAIRLMPLATRASWSSTPRGRVWSAPSAAPGAPPNVASTVEDRRPLPLDDLTDPHGSSRSDPE